MNGRLISTPSSLLLLRNITDLCIAAREPRSAAAGGAAHYVDSQGGEYFPARLADTHKRARTHTPPDDTTCTHSHAHPSPPCLSLPLPRAREHACARTFLRCSGAGSRSDVRRESPPRLRPPPTARGGPVLLSSARRAGRVPSAVSERLRVSVPFPPCGRAWPLCCPRMPSVRSRSAGADAGREDLRVAYRQFRPRPAGGASTSSHRSRSRSR